MNTDMTLDKKFLSVNYELHAASDVVFDFVL